MKIPENLIPYAYQESKRIFDNELSVKEAAENINKTSDININSCADYPRAYSLSKTFIFTAITVKN
jgi:hypothetical protein